MIPHKHERDQHPSDIQGPSELGDHNGLPVVGSITLSRHPSIRVLSDDVLLVVFGFYMVSSPWHWHRLAHVCQRWRLIVFASPRSLDLRLYCTPTTPVQSALHCWPAFPITIWCERSQYTDASCEVISRENEANIVAALQCHNRVHSIKLCLTSWFAEQLSKKVKEPLSELEDLILLPISRRHILLSSPPFRWGSRLRVLHLTDISFPSFPILLSSTPNLVDIRLHNYFRCSLTSPELPSTVALANALSGMTRLKSLSLHFFSLTYLRTPTGAPLPSGRRVVLPALTRFQFRGSSQDLEGLVAEIDSPCLRKIKITFVNRVRSLSELGQFIGQIGAQRLHRRAEIQISTDYISIRFTPSGLTSPSYLVLRLRDITTRLNERLSSTALVYNLLPPFLLGIGDLGIVTGPPSSGKDAVDRENWLRLLHPFSDVKRFYVAGELATNIMNALKRADGEFATVLPALRKLDVAMEPEALCAPFQAAVASFTSSRQLSGHPMEVEYSGTQLGSDGNLSVCGKWGK